MNRTLPAYYSVGEGPPVLLLHCTLSSKNQWRALTGKLSRQFRFLVPDLYGYGESPFPQRPEGFSLLDEVELVDNLVREQLAPGERLQLVGHSYGGAVALRYCYRFPERVAALTLFEPVAFHLLPPEAPELAAVREMMTTLHRLVASGERREAVATFIDYWSGAGSFNELPPRVQQDFVARSDKLLLDFQALTAPSPTLAKYRQLRIPVTLLTGSRSKPSSLTVAAELAAILPDCRVLSLDTGHMGPVSAPELVNPIISEALLRHRERR